MGDSIFEIIESYSPRDKLMAYLQSSRKADIHLTTAEMEYMEQLDYADNLVRTHPTAIDKDIINMLVERYAISVTKARNILLDARYVHGTMAKPVKAYERLLLNDFLKRLMHEEHSKGNAKNAIAAAELYAKINQLDLPEEEQPDQNTGVVIIRPAFDPKQLGVEMPDDIEQLVKEIRSNTRRQQNALNSNNA